MDQYTVSSLTGAIHKLLRGQFDDVRVAGEISGYKVWSSGHAYFTLKDAGAQIRCVLFRVSMRYLRFQPVDGLAVVARGSVEVRQERGEYQLIVSSITPDGVGALQAAFENLKQKLAAEGLFAAERKKTLPTYPRRIGIVTSPKGAVIRDMLTVLARRWPGLEIRLWPTPVQGAGAVEGVCAGLRYFSESGWADVVIVGRGGGSLEDLYTFNDEAVARAIAASTVPVISAVGHEVDFTIADFVADLRAPTPSAAAEIVVRDQVVILASVDEGRQRLGRAVRYLLSRVARRLQKQGTERAANLVARQIGRGWQALDELGERLRAADPRARLIVVRQRLEQASQRLTGSMHARMSGARGSSAAAATGLRAADPRARLMKARKRLQESSQPLAGSVHERLSSARQRFGAAEMKLRGTDPRARLMVVRKRLEAASQGMDAVGLGANIAARRALVQRAEHGLAGALRAQLHGARLRVEPLAARLGALSPEAILDRGYAIVTNEQGRVVKTPADAPLTTRVRARVARGTLTARVEAE